MIANARGRSQVTWFLISFLISPLLGFIVLVLMPNLKEKPATAMAAPTPAAPSQTPPCPRCGSARVPGQMFCPSCGLDLWAEYDSRR